MIKHNLKPIQDWNFDDDNIKKVYYNSSVVYLKVSVGQEPSYEGKLKLEYSDGTYDELQCSSSSTLTRNDVMNLRNENKTITSFTIGDCVNEIGNAAFYDVDDNYNEGLIFRNVSSINFGKNTTILGAISFGQWKNNSINLVIPYNLTNLEDQAFGGNESLKSVVFENNNLTTLSRGLFSECKNLEHVSLPSNLKELNSDLFAFCDSLSRIDLPSGITKIGDNCFYFLGSTTPEPSPTLEELDIPSTIQEMGSHIFSNCSSLKRLYVRATTPPTLGSNIFDGIPIDKRPTIYVPSESLELYKTATNWEQFSSNIQPIT